MTDIANVVKDVQNANRKEIIKYDYGRQFSKKISDESYLLIFSPRTVFLHLESGLTCDSC